MTIRFAVTPEDYMRFNLYHHQHSRQLKNTTRALRFLFWFAAVIIALVALTRKDWGGFVLVLLFIIGGAFSGKLSQYSLKKGIQRQLGAGMGAEYCGERSISLTDVGVRLIDSRQMAEMLYPALVRISWDEDRLYIYTGSVSAILIMPWAFTSEWQRQEFLRLLLERAPQLAYPRA